MKKYVTKTGVELKVIQGLGLGDGIPRGFAGTVYIESNSQPIKSNRVVLSKFKQMTLEKHKDLYVIFENNEVIFSSSDKEEAKNTFSVLCLSTAI